MALISVVIPALDEAEGLPLLLADLACDQGLIAEVIVVDGGSVDATAAAARLAGARVVRAAGGRGAQLAAGIALAGSPWLWLLHADIRLGRDWPRRLVQVLVAPVDGRPRAWYGRLRVPLPGLHYRLLELAVRLRSRCRQLPYGDQGLLLTRGCHDRVGGIRPLALMEDLDFAQRLARHGRFHSLGLPVQVDARRWRRLGLLRTIWVNACLRRAWRRGVAPQLLLQRYQAMGRTRRRSAVPGVPASSPEPGKSPPPQDRQTG